MFATASKPNNLHKQITNLNNYIMEIITKSGSVTVNKKSPYGKWLQGYTTTNGWTGWYTLEQMWEQQKNNKPKGCSWFAWGVICGKILNPLYSRINILKEECGSL